MKRLSKNAELETTRRAERGPTGTLRAARYLRVSRADQNPALQDHETSELIERRGWILVDTYEDRGFSGSRDQRPELDRLLADARWRRFDVLVVWRSDRLFRSLKHMVNVLDDLGALGVAFVSCTEPFDTSTPSGKLLLHLVSAFSQFEREILIERTRAGIAAARRRGVRVGRPQVDVDVERALELRAAGKSYQRIAEVLGVSVGKLHGAIKALSGDVQKTSVEGTSQSRATTGRV